jgi:hypothetical protein
MMGMAVKSLATPRQHCAMISTDETTATTIDPTRMDGKTVAEIGTMSNVANHHVVLSLTNFQALSAPPAVEMTMNTARARMKNKPLIVANSPIVTQLAIANVSPIMENKHCTKHVMMASIPVQASRTIQ